MDKTLEKLIKTRWFILLIFIIGFIFTVDFFDKYIFIYLFFNILSFSGAVFILSYKPRYLFYEIPVWLFFLYVILAYYIKFYLLVKLGNRFSSQGIKYLEKYTGNPDVMIEVFVFLSLFFFLACILLRFFLTFHSKKYIKRVQMNNNLKRINILKVKILFFISISIYVLFSFISYKTGISVLGQTSIYLPFRMAGIIFYSRRYVVLIIFLLSIWASEHNNNKKLNIFYLVFFVLYLVSEMLLTASRGVIILGLLYLMFIYIITSNINLKIIKRFIYFTLVSIFMFPFITGYRYWRKVSNLKEVSLISFLNNFKMIDSDFLSLFSNSISKVFFRLVGVDTLIVINGEKFKNIGYDSFEKFKFLGGEGISHIMTHEIVNHPIGISHSEAPGFLGWFKIIGGDFFVIFGGIMFLFMALFIWDLIYFSKIKLKTIYLTSYLILYFLVITGGDIDRILKFPTIITILTLIFLEIIFRFRFFIKD